MRSQLNTNLALKVAFYTVITATLFGLLIGSYQTWSNFQDRKQRSHDSVQSIIDTTKPSISLATYNFNTHLNQQLIDGLAAHPAIINATITNDMGREIIIANNPQVCTHSNMSTILHGSNNQLIFPLVYLNTHLGKLTLELNHCNLTQLFYHELKTTLVSNIILSMSIALFIYFIFYQLVSLPLSNLVRRLQGIDPSDIDFSTLNQMNSTRQDEIGLLINHFSELLHTTHDQINRLKAAEHTINNYSANLEELVNKKTKALTDINGRLKEVNQELELSQELTEQFTQSQFKLLKGITKEFEVPVETTLSVLSIAQESCETAADHSRIQSSIHQNLIITSLLKELNSIANLKSSVDLQQTSPFSFSDIFSDIEKRIRQHESKSIIDIDYSELTSNRHIGSRERIEQLLFNLIANTFQCSNDYKLKVHLSEANNSVLVTISAHELYIPEHYFDLMILPFSNPLTHSRITTLGLGFTKDLTELLSGQVKLLINSQNEHVLLLQLPLLSSDIELNKIRHQLPSGGIRINIHQQLLSNKVKEALKSWQLDFIDSSESASSPVLLITDQYITEKDTCFTIGLGHTFSPKESLNDIGLISLDTFNDSYLFNAITNACTSIQKEYKPAQLAKILLVEDNAINRMLSQRFLKNLNTDVEMVENGREALEACSNKKYDLIFMDCKMPIMDGFQATRQIRCSHLNKHTPIIALTGLDSETERQSCLQSGMNDFISKPYTQEQLQDAISQWLPSEKN